MKRNIKLYIVLFFVAGSFCMFKYFTKALSQTTITYSEIGSEKLTTLLIEDGRFVPFYNSDSTSNLLVFMNKEDILHPTVAFSSSVEIFPNERLVHSMKIKIVQIDNPTVRSIKKYLY